MRGRFRGSIRVSCIESTGCIVKKKHYAYRIKTWKPVCVYVCVCVRERERGNDCSTGLCFVLSVEVLEASEELNQLSLTQVL